MRCQLLGVSRGATRFAQTPRKNRPVGINSDRLSGNRGKGSKRSLQEREGLASGAHVAGWRCVDLGHYPESHEKDQQEAGQRQWVFPRGEFSLSLSTMETESERRFQAVPGHLHPSFHLLVAGQPFDRRIDQKAAVPERPPRRLLGEPFHQSPDEGERLSLAVEERHRERILLDNVSVQRLEVQLVLAAEGVVEAGFRDSQMLDEVRDGRGFVTPLPEKLDRLIENDVRIKLCAARHCPSPRCSTPAAWLVRQS